MLRPGTLRTRHMELCEALRRKCQLRFHISIETDREEMPGLPPHASAVARRLEAFEQLRGSGHFTVVTVSPLLPIEDPDVFFMRLSQPANRDKRWTSHGEDRVSHFDGQDEPRVRPLDYRGAMAQIAHRHVPGRVGSCANGFAGVHNQADLITTACD